MSANYALDYTNSIADDVPVEGMQESWRFCGKCLGLFWSGDEHGAVSCRRNSLHAI